MTKPGDGREGILGEILDELKDLMGEGDVPKPPDDEDVDSRPRPAPSVGSSPIMPPSSHDSEQRVPPDASGSIDE